MHTEQVSAMATAERQMQSSAFRGQVATFETATENYVLAAWGEVITIGDLPPVDKGKICIREFIFHEDRFWISLGSVVTRNLPGVSPPREEPRLEINTSTPLFKGM